MSIIAFIKSRILLKHIIYAVFVVVALLWGSLKVLDIYTMHGRTITVPDFEGMYLEDVEHVTARLNLRYVINDSIFDSSREKGTIAGQDPVPGSQVKKNRTVYLTSVAKLPEMVAMPEITDLSLRQAISVLKSLHIRVGKLIYEQDIAQNAVIRPLYNQGTIEPGTQIERGTYIDLVLGKGSSLSRVPVPLVIGKSREEARMEIQSASLNIGKEVFLDNERDEARVYRQEPDVLSRKRSLLMGSTVDIYYRSDNEFDFEAYLDDVMSVNTPYLKGRSPEEAKRIIENSFLVVGAEYFPRDVDREDTRVSKQEPDPGDHETIYRDTRINLWYKSIDELDDENDETIDEE
ncbi:MAG: PASTA domain-containing protein [Bacteroidota bacterium]